MEIIHININKRRGDPPFIIIAHSMHPKIFQYLLGGVRAIERSDITDLNNELGTGNRLTIYFAAPSQAPANLPSDISLSARFFLEIINTSDADVIQRVTSRNSNVTYQRTYSTTSQAWTPWSQL